jgi:ankyrin repeat protein
MRLQYKTMEDEYLLLVNAKTVEGDTPIMIAILYESREAIHTLLEYGGSDIYLINNNKMTAYQLAVSNKN